MLAPTQMLHRRSEIDEHMLKYEETIQQQDSAKNAESLHPWSSLALKPCLHIIARVVGRRRRR
jgi:hypothetical protein